MKITREAFKNIVREVMTEESEYQEFFKRALEKTGKSIPDMSDEEKKAFFNKIDAAWQGKGEKNEELVGNQAKLDVDGDGEIEASDLAALRAGKKVDEAANLKTIAMLFQNKGIKDAVRKDHADKLRKIIEDSGVSTKGVSDSELIKVVKQLTSESVNEVELPAATIPAAVKSKLMITIDKIKDTKLSYNQKIQVVGQVMDSLGIDKAEFTKMTSKLKGTIESVNESNEKDILDKIEKLRVLSNAGKITGDQFLDKFMPLWKQLKGMKESVNEGSHGMATKLLQSIVSGDSSKAEGTKMSKELAQHYIDWIRTSPFGKKNGNLPLDMLVKASFNWGIERGLDSKLKGELSKLKSTIKESLSPEVAKHMGSIHKGFKKVEDDGVMVYDSPTNAKKAADFLNSKKIAASSDGKFVYLESVVNEAETFTATNKATGKTSIFKSKDSRDAAVKAGTHTAIKDPNDGGKTKSGVNIFNNPTKASNDNGDDGFGYGPETDRTPATSLPKKASQLDDKHASVVSDTLNKETGLDGYAQIDDNTGAIMFNASKGESPTYTLYIGSNEDYGKPNEFRVSLESTYGEDPAGLDGKIDKSFKTAEEAMAFAAQVAKKHKKELEMDDDTNESSKSVSEGVSPKEMDTIKSAVQAASSFMGVGAELKKLGMKYTFATEPLPIYIIQPTPNNKVAIVNKKYASKPDFVHGDIAVGVMEGKAVKSVTEGRAFINAARKAKTEGLTEFEFNGKKYPVTIKD